MNYQSLDQGDIVKTIDTLHKRISERFPDFSLSKICKRLLSISQEARNQADWIAKPIISLRIGSCLLIIIIVAGFIGTLAVLQLPTSQVNFFQFIQILESGINDLVLIGIAVFFLVSIERRIKRRRALDSIHELRALAHIIDMHQLTKEPGPKMWKAKDTASSPKKNINTLSVNEVSGLL